MKITIQDRAFSTPFIVGGVSFDDVIDKIYSYRLEPYYCQGFTSYKITLNDRVVYDSLNGISCAKEFKEELLSCK
jgi:hypothetical protein